MTVRGFLVSESPKDFFFTKKLQNLRIVFYESIGMPGVRYSFAAL